MITLAENSTNWGLYYNREVFASLLIGLLSLWGCSSNSASTENQKPVHPVMGSVTVSGQPAIGAEVLLTPVNEPAEPKDPRPRATVGDDGSFAVSTYGANDGAPVGDYVVTIVWPGGVLPDGREEPEDKLLGKYRNAKQSQLRATVKEGPNELPPFKL